MMSLIVFGFLESHSPIVEMNRDTVEVKESLKIFLGFPSLKHNRRFLLPISIIMFFALPAKNPEGMKLSKNNDKTFCRLDFYSLFSTALGNCLSSLYFLIQHSVENKTQLNEEKKLIKPSTIHNPHNELDLNSIIYKALLRRKKMKRCKAEVIFRRHR